MLYIQSVVNRVRDCAWAKRTLKSGKSMPMRHSIVIDANARNNTIAYNATSTKTAIVIAINTNFDDFSGFSKSQFEHSTDGRYSAGKRPPVASSLAIASSADRDGAARAGKSENRDA